MDKAYPEESKEEKEKATKELVEKLSGQRVKTTDDLKDGSAIHKTLEKIDPNHFQITKADEQEKDDKKRVKKIVELTEKYFTEKLGRDVPVGTVNADKVDKKKKDDKDLFKLTDLVIGAALLGRNKEANKKAVSQLDEKSQKTIEKIADKVDRDHPEGSRQEKEKATKELIQDLSGKSVRSTDDLTDGTAIRKALLSSTLATSKRRELMLRRETQLARSRRQSSSSRSTTLRRWAAKLQRTWSMLRRLSKKETRTSCSSSPTWL